MNDQTLAASLPEKRAFVERPLKLIECPLRGPPLCAFSEKPDWRKLFLETGQYLPRFSSVSVHHWAGLLSEFSHVLKKICNICLSVIWAGVSFICSLSMLPTAFAGQQAHNFNASSDPSALYGSCGANSGVREKKIMVKEANGPNLNKIEEIYVLDCTTYSGGGGSFVVPCPSGVEATYCVRSLNDGVGNAVLLGVFINDKLPCQVKEKGKNKIDISFQDSAWGISTIEFRSGVSNAQTNFKRQGSDLDPIILTANKIDKGAVSNLQNILVTNGAGIVSTCSFSF